MRIIHSLYLHIVYIYIQTFLYYRYICIYIYIYMLQTSRIYIYIYVYNVFYLLYSIFRTIYICVFKYLCINVYINIFGYIYIHLYIHNGVYIHIYSIYICIYIYHLRQSWSLRVNACGLPVIRRPTLALNHILCTKLY